MTNTTTSKCSTCGCLEDYIRPDGTCMDCYHKTAPTIERVVSAGQHRDIAMYSDGSVRCQGCGRTGLIAQRPDWIEDACAGIGELREPVDYDE